MKQEKPYTQSQIVSLIADELELPKKTVDAVFLAMGRVAAEQLRLKQIGQVVVPRLGVKIKMVKKPATKARMGRNPATGEEIKIEAKPARRVLKARVLAALKEATLP